VNNKGFMGIVALLLAVAIISCFAYFVFTKYFGKPTGMDQSTQEMADQAGIDTTSQTSILGSVKSVIKGVNEAQQENGYN
jgi:uncharacterized protein YpmB